MYEPRLFGQVVFHPYRTATVRERFLTTQRDTVLEDALAKEAGNRPDNHTVYEIKTRDGAKAYVMFHDLQTIFGLAIEVRNW